MEKFIKSEKFINRKGEEKKKKILILTFREEGFKPTFELLTSPF